MSTVATRKPWARAKNTTGHYTTSTSYIDLSGLSVNLNCSGKRPVLVKLIQRSGVQSAYFTANCGNGASGGIYLKAVASWTFITPQTKEAETYFGRNWGSGVNVGTDIRNFPASFGEWILYPGAGLVNFKIQAKVSGSIQAFQTQGIDIFVMEL